MYLIKMRRIKNQFSFFSSVLSSTHGFHNQPSIFGMENTLIQELPGQLCTVLFISTYLLTDHYMSSMGVVVVGKKDVVLTLLELTLVGRMSINKLLFNFDLLSLSV